MTSLLFVIQRLPAQGVQDSTHSFATERAIDSSYSRITPIPFVGSVERFPTYIITDSTINFFDYNYAGDLLSVVPGRYTFDLGSPGQLHGITIDGGDNHAVAFMSDGVLLNEPMTGTYNQYLFPSEQTERVEIITGVSAFYYGLNSNAGAINFVSKSKRAIHPYSRVRYTDAPDGHTLVDGSFSQDIVRGMNLSLGAFHHAYDGRFHNSTYDEWNIRGKVRYNITNRFDVYASLMYNKTNLGLNGGVDLAKTQPQYIYDELRATVVDSVAHEDVTRYDAQLGVAGEFFDDTTAVTTLTLYHSTNFREYRNEENLYYPNGVYVAEDDRSQWYGFKLVQHVEIPTVEFDAGMEAQHRGLIASDSIGQHIRNMTSGFAKIMLHPANSISLTGYGRVDNYLDQTLFSLGGNLGVNISDNLKLFGGLSRSYRFPTFQELYEGTIVGYSSTPQEHQLVEAGISLT